MTKQNSGLHDDLILGEPDKDPAAGPREDGQHLDWEW